MTIDWNWFFAAFAQSGAALIAIIGAFIISKLLGETEKKEQYSDKVEGLIIHYNDLTKRISNRYFNWYDEQNIKYSYELRDAIKNGDFKNLNDGDKLKKLFEILPNLFGTDGCLGKLNERINKLTPKTTKLKSGLSIVNEPLDINLPPNGLWANLSEEKEAINSLQIESETLIEQFRKTRNNINVVTNNLIPIKITIIILIVGVLMTVIYPLHFMPLRIGEIPNIKFSFSLFFELLLSLKGLLLLILTVVIEGIFGYFLMLTIKTEKNYKIIKKRLENKYFDIKSYSKYFE